MCFHLSFVEPARHPSPRPPHAVVIEGDVALRRLLAFALERSGFAVSSWADDSAFVRQLDGANDPPAPVELLVADVDTPGGASPAKLAQIRQRLPHLCVVLIGALGDASLARLAVRIGARRVLEKPFDLARLLHFARSAVAGEAPSGCEEAEASDSTQGAA